jgi:hypothetical protein
MTVAVQTPVITYQGNGTAAPLAIPFAFLVDDHIRVIATTNGVETLLVLGTHYLLTGAGNPNGGTVTPLAVIANGTTWQIERRTAIEQPTNYVEGQGFPAQSHETGLDRLAMIAQEQDAAQADLVVRALQVPRGAAPPPSLDLTGVQENDILVMRGGKLQRMDVAPFAGKFWVGSATGHPVSSSGTGNDAALRSDLALGNGGDLIGYEAPCATAGITILRRTRDRLGEQISLFDVIPDALQAAIKAGNSNVDVVAYINLALLHFERVIVRRGVYRHSSPVLFAHSEQVLEFEDGAWFHPLNGSTNGIAVPHNKLDCRLINPGLIGEAATSANATGVLWNSNAAGTAPFGSATSDDMGGRIENARFKQAAAGKAWNTHIHGNMAGGLVIDGYKGRGLIGTASDHGYGAVVSGKDITIRNADIDAVIAGEGRHGIYAGDQTEGLDVAGVRIRNFRKTGLAANCSVTNGNRNMRFNQILLENVALDADSSATNGAIGFDFQGAAASGGDVLTMSNIQIKNAGAMGVFIKGYRRLKLDCVNCIDWGSAPGGSYVGLKLQDCDDAQVMGFRSYTAAANNGAHVIQHVFVQECEFVQVIGGGAWNTGSGAQAAALHLNATGAGTHAAIIDRFVADKGAGSWSISPFVNPTQNGSAITYAREGGTTTDVQSGAGIVLDATDGASHIIMAAGATELLNILPVGLGQVVTVHFTSAVNVLGTNFYGSAPYTAAAQRTLTLYCFSAAGASSLWRELAKG